MKTVFLYILLSMPLANANVLITYFDPFDGGSRNNSKPVALGVAETLGSEFQINHCELTTAFGRATQDLLDCINNLDTPPQLVISLGEYGCGRVKLETVANNWAFGNGRDNLGQVRRGEKIIEEGPEKLGLNIDWAQAFCGLDYRSQKSMTIASSNADAYVCNETMYNMSYFYSHIPFGFIHVPAHNCRRQRIPESIQIISHIVRELVRENRQHYTPYSTERNELQNQRNNSQDECERDFLRRLLTTY